MGGGTQPRRDVRVTLDDQQANKLRTNPHIAAALADLTGEFTRGDLPPEVERELKSLLNVGVVRRVKRYNTNGSGTRPGDHAVWAVPEHIRRWIEAHVDWSPPPGPCDHPGIRNRRGHDGDEAFTCSDADCGETFGRDVAAARLERDD